MKGAIGIMFLWLTIMLNTLGTTAPGPVARDAGLAPQTWSPWQAVGTARYFWLILCAVGESFLSFAFQAEPPNSPVLVLKFKESRLLKQMVFADCETLQLGEIRVAKEDKEKEWAYLQLPRTEQKSIFFASIQTLSYFLPCSCSQHAPPAFT